MTKYYTIEEALRFHELDRLIKILKNDINTVKHNRLEIKATNMIRDIQLDSLSLLEGYSINTEVTTLIIQLLENHLESLEVEKEKLGKLL